VTRRHGLACRITRQARIRSPSRNEIALSDVLSIEKWDEDMTDDKDTWIVEAARKLDVAAMHLKRALEEGAASVHITEALRHIEEAKSKLRGEL
jgi:hypothetical protein